MINFYILSVFLMDLSIDMQIGMLHSSIKMSATNANTFLPMRTIMGCAYKMHSVRDLRIRMPIAVDAAIARKLIIACNHDFFILFVNLNVNPTVMPITRLPIAHPGIPRSPLVNKQYSTTPITPTKVPLIIPKE